jgi:hypothetical protein
VYAGAAKAERHKSFQNVDVSFDNDGQAATAHRASRSAAAPPDRESGAAEQQD